ncbi:hypothetical protein BU26DRAFT_507557 [Trematosphaeria pertusa]|uniref:Uncharacterized protein n=1 Tax=Trematosphaeria pertusa TaxID=390896 RepID=A0A6A6I8P0_9PLEO|nr:uncharacterized protein BU26DRAFT_507557 [Trematosphaeria pertusa]KAF2245883.1 hypothetical protein BU26DRAFT_507557 [Trematosphaeria pertusa]
MSSTPSSSPPSVSSTQSSQDMSLAPPPSPSSMHPFLPPSRASTITSWTSSLPERGSRCHPSSDRDALSRDAAIEAYRQLKLALFSKARSLSGPEMERPTS